MHFQSFGTFHNHRPGTGLLQRRAQVLYRAGRPQASEGSKEQGSSHKDVGDAVKDLLKTDPAAYDRIEKVRQAAAVVAELQAEKDEMDRALRDSNYDKAWQSQDQEQDQAQRAAERGAGQDVLTAAQALQQAKNELDSALSDKSKWSVAVNEEAEKLESGKAGAVAALGAVLGTVPYLLGSREPALTSLTTLAAALITGLLFGVTYRYAVRSDLGNSQLKAGVLGAFGLARGLALSEEILRIDGLSASSAGQAALACGQSVISIGFAAAALELAFQKGFVKPFGTAS